MILMPDDVALTIDAIADSVATGAWPQEELDAKVRQVLTLKARAGFFDKGFDPQIHDLDRKITAARRRDSTLLRRIDSALRQSSQPEIKPIYRDRTLVLDKGGQ
jgi:beta-glucosidase-like glycosyl hydrolase